MTCPKAGWLNRISQPKSPPPMQELNDPSGLLGSLPPTMVIEFGAPAVLMEPLPAGPGGATSPKNEVVQVAGAHGPEKPEMDPTAGIDAASPNATVLRQMQTSRLSS